MTLKKYPEPNRGHLAVPSQHQLSGFDMSSKHSAMPSVPPLPQKFNRLDQKKVSSSPKVRFAQQSSLSSKSAENHFTSFENSPQFQLKNINESSKRLFSKVRDKEQTIMDLTGTNKPISPVLRNKMTARRRRKIKKCPSAFNFKVEPLLIEIPEN